MAFVYHRQQGIGPALLLLHGFCETHQIWDDLLPGLAKHFEVLTPDLPGFGKSDLLQSNFSISDVSDTMLQWLRSVGTVPAVVIGHSLGGYVAMAMAAKNPGAFAGVGLFHSTAAADSDEKKQNRNKTIEFVKANGVNAFVDVFVPSLFYQQANPNIARVYQMARGTSLETLVAYSQAMRDRPPQEAWLKAFHNNFLIVAGDHDPLIPINLLKQQAALAPKGTFCELPQVGHMGMFEAPEKAIEVVKSFTFACFKDFRG